MSFLFTNLILSLFFNPLYSMEFDEFDNFKSNLPVCSQIETPKNYYHKCFGKKLLSEIFPDNRDGYYIGEWLFDRPHGIGKMHRIDEYRTTIGTFRNGYNHGAMSRKFKSAKHGECTGQNNMSFGVGHGKIKGECEFNSRYEGNLFYGDFSGYAKIIEDGISIEGMYFGGKVTGTFEVTSDKTCDQSGQFYEAQPHGQHIYSNCPKTGNNIGSTKGFYYFGSMINGEVYNHDGSLRSKGIYLGGELFNGYLYTAEKNYRYLNGEVND